MQWTRVTSMSMTSFSGYQFKVFINDGERSGHPVQHHSLYLYLCVCGFLTAVYHGMALVAPENATDVRWLHADAGNMALADVTQNYCLGVVTAVTVDSELAILSPSELAQVHRLLKRFDLFNHRAQHVAGIVLEHIFHYDVDGFAV